MKTILTLLAFAGLTISAFAQAPIVRSPYTTNAPGATVNAASGSLTNLNTVRGTLGDFITLRANGTNINALVQWLPYSPGDFATETALQDLAEAQGLLELEVDGKQDAHSTLSNIVNTVTVDDAGNMGVTTLTTGVGDVDDSIEAINNFLNDLNPVQVGPTNELFAASGIDVEGPVSHRTDYYEGGAVSLDLGIASSLSISLTNDTLSIAYANRKDSTGRIVPYTVFITNTVDDIGSIEWGDATPTSIVPYDQIGPLEVAKMSLEDRDGVLRYEYVGPQLEVLPPELGGSGDTNQSKIIIWPIADTSGAGSNRYDINLSVTGEDTEFRIESDLPIYINASSGRSSTTNRAVRGNVRAHNYGATTNELTQRSDYGLVGFTNHTTYLEPGQYGLWRHSSEGPTEGLTWIYNQLTSVQAVVEGGTPPASTLNDGLVAYWNFNATSVSVWDNILGNAALDLAELGSAMGEGFTGIDGLSITNAGSRMVTNANALLNFGQSGESFSMSGWLAPTSVAVGYTAGKGDFGSTDGAWRWRLNSDNSLAFQVSSNGSSITSASGGVVAASQWNHVVTVFNNPADTIQTYVNGVAGTPVAFTSDLHNATAGFSIAGATISGAVNSKQGAYDDFGVWDRAITTAEVAELYAVGAGKFPDGSGVFAP